MKTDLAAELGGGTPLEEEPTAREDDLCEWGLCPICYRNRDDNGLCQNPNCVAYGARPEIRGGQG